METYLTSERSRRYVVCPAKSGKEVVERVIVSHIDHREADAPFVSFAAKQVVLTDGQIEEASRRDARRMMVVILLVDSRH